MQSGKHYAWETCGPLAVHLQENGQNLKKYHQAIIWPGIKPRFFTQQPPAGIGNINNQDI